MTIEPELSLDQPRQINHLAPDGVLAKDSPRPESFSDLISHSAPPRSRPRNTDNSRGAGDFHLQESQHLFTAHAKNVAMKHVAQSTARDLPYSSVGTAKEKTEEQRRRRREDENLAQAGEPD